MAIIGQLNIAWRLSGAKAEPDSGFQFHALIAYTRRLQKYWFCC